MGRNITLQLTTTQQGILDEIKGKIMRHFGKQIEDATENMMYKACALTVRDEIMRRWQDSHAEVKKAGAKKLYYLSSEFLMGRLLGANMLNLALTNDYVEVFKYIGMDINTVEDMEPDAGLGNGGLGRLAACFLDSLTTLDLPAYGSTIRYEYGLFRQKIIEGYQFEQPDSWLDNGYVWEVQRPEEQVEVRFGGKVHTDWSNEKFSFRYENSHTVLAVPYDVPVCGYDSKIINKLRLWSAKAPTDLNMKFFNEGQYIRAIEEKDMAEVISKVLYPEDNHNEGKMLRLRQQYFLVSATVQWIIRDFKHFYGDNWSIFPQKIAIHINDTHPALAIPEMMRVLMDDEHMGWEEAWGIVTKTFGYTNHTVMSEALEKWPVGIFESLLPRIYMIVQEIHRRLLDQLYAIYPGDQPKIEYMSIITPQNQISMANLCLATCYAVNGVSKLHTEILTSDIFADYYRIDPSRFHAITNGITFRRWIMYCNPSLTQLICDSIGAEWLKDASKLSKLAPYADDADFCGKFADIKMQNKIELAKYIKEHNCIDVDVESIFDVQAKRLHEYKRQLLSALHIMYLANCIIDNNDDSIVPRTFIFAAKASPGYKRAKLIIKLINSIADWVNNDPRIGGKLKVVFIENYGVTLAEKIMTAADVSEQISTAGKEASGTGNMKFMLNGAVTIGTFDGANVEMSEQVGMDNMYIFGLSAQEVKGKYQLGSADAQSIYAENMPLKKVLDQLIDGTLEPDKPQLFKEIYQSLLFGDYGFADPYMVVRDFEAYVDAQHQMSQEFLDKKLWNKKAVLNTAYSGFFSSDRTIEGYNHKIWKLKKI